MTNVEFKFPVLLFKDGERQIYSLKQDLGIVSVGGDTFYRRLVVIDSSGSVYRLREAAIKGKASFLCWFKYFQQMMEMDLRFEKTDMISLSELKSRIIEHIKEHPKYWITLGSIEDITSDIQKEDTFEAVISKFI